MEDVACFEDCETEFRYSKCVRQGSVEAPVERRVTQTLVVGGGQGMEGQVVGNLVWRRR